MARKITFIPANQTQIEGNLASQIKKIRMAAYCRVSTNHEDQQLSYENQVRFYTDYISNDPKFELANIYADEGLVH